MSDFLPLSHKRAICYSGFRDGQSPDSRVFPSKDEIASDFRILQGDWDALRLYACDTHCERVLEVISEQGFDFKVMLGAYLAAELSNPNCPWGGQHRGDVLEQNRQENLREVERAVALANRYPDIVDVVSAGNEATVDWTDHLVAPESVVNYVEYLQRHIVQPVTFCENYVPWLGKLDRLAGQVDLISIHSYPVWEYKTIDEAMAYTRENYAAVCQRHPDKQVIITEAGWATASNGRGIPPENVSEFCQKRYLDELRKWSADDGILIYLFEAFDENWKGSEHPLEPEKHWGLYRANRQPKLAVC
jgi:exo-beta-1,3-glucanase (GH17 family)